MKEKFADANNIKVISFDDLGIDCWLPYRFLTQGCTRRCQSFDTCKLGCKVIVPEYQKLIDEQTALKEERKALDKKIREYEEEINKGRS